jgi:Spy/CpxP family protein refolding chaperone
LKDYRQKFLGLLAVALLIAGGTWGLAQLPAASAGAVRESPGRMRSPGVFRRGPDRVRAVEIISHYLDLTDGQASQIREILEGAQSTIKPLREEIQPLRQSLRDELDSGAAVAGSVGQLVIQIHGLGDQIRSEQQSAADSIRSLLNDEQIHKVEAVRQAAQLVPVIRAFGVLGLLPPPQRQARAAEDQVQ